MGENYVIIFGKVLLFVSSLDTSLVQPNQMRATGCVVYGVPKHFSKGKYLHKIYTPEKDLIITFSVRVMMSYINK